MRVALGVHRIAADPVDNLSAMNAMAIDAAANRADLVVFSEAALTGFIGSGDPDHDRLLSQTIPGEATRALSETARHVGIAVAFGLYEIDEEQRLYDSAVLIDPDGRISLHYRRISPQWRGPDDDPEIYREGVDLPATRTAFGRTCILLCGDLFDDVIVRRAAALPPDLVLVPFAREFDSEVRDEAAWYGIEINVYAERVALTGANGALVNQIGPGKGRHFGGAFVTAPSGSVLGSRALGAEGLLYVDL